MPAQIDCDDPESQGEGFFLLRPHSPVQGKGVEKDDGKTGSSVAVGDGDAVDLSFHMFSVSRFS
jgi:hypothetical protein